MPDGSVDLSGVWVLFGSPKLPSDPAYQPEGQKLYADVKPATAKAIPKGTACQTVSFRMTPYPYKIVQSAKMSSASK